MKVLAINGSSRKEGNTSILLKTALAELEKEGIQTELIQLAGREIKSCISCWKCFERKDKRCAVKDDMVNEIIEKMIAADGIILGSPTYFSNVSSQLKALIDRSGLVGIANDYLYKRKVGAAVVAVRRAGAVHVFNSINHFFTINQMIIPGSIYWNLGVGLMPGDVKTDEEGMNTMKTLGENMAWLMKKLED